MILIILFCFLFAWDFLCIQTEFFLNVVGKDAYPRLIFNKMALGLGALYNWQLWHCEGASWILWSKRVGFLIWLGWVSLFWAVQDGFFQFPLQELRNQLLVYSQTGQIQDAYHIRLKLQKYTLRFRSVAKRSSPLLILYYRPLKEHLHRLVQKFLFILV